MCGLFGWVSPVSPDGKQIDDSIAACFGSMQYRGPDDRGVASFSASSGWSEKPEPTAAEVLIAHLRLSILDLSERGHQPMVSPNGRYRIVYNGEVYNYRELRSELASEGFSFSTDSDTEVVLAALIHWGVEAANRFVGMFALAFHDEVEKRLLLIRDHFGIKPLYYARSEQGLFGFASELPALVSMPGIRRKVNAQRVYDYLLFGDYDSDVDTMIDGVSHLLPGCYMVIDSEKGETVDHGSYWKPELAPLQHLSFSDAAEKLRSIFLDNIRLHLRSDVPLGAALSGGVDSSAVVASIRNVYPDFDLKAFTYVASGSDMDEERWADLVIHQTGASSHKVSISAQEMVADLDDLIRTQGEPFGSTSIYAQYRVFKLAREAGVTVTLDGQGADELLAGYYGFPGERLKSLLSEGRVVDAWKFFNATSNWPGRSKAMVFKRLVGAYTPESLYSLAWSFGQGTLRPEWLGDDWFEQQGISFEVPRGERVCDGNRYVHRELARAMTRRGLPGLLRHGDRNSMRFSIESRVPFLTREMAEFVLSLPEEYLIARDGTTKAVFKEAMRDIVPQQILDRRDKIGFATPEKRWLQQLSPWVEETLADASDMPQFRQLNLQRSWQEILAGNKAFDWQVWRWLNFIRWARLFDVDVS